MREKKKIDLGSVQVHKKVLREIICLAVTDMDGVGFSKDSFVNRAVNALGVGKYRGIKIRVNEKQEVSVEVRIYIRYGLNIPDIAGRVQDVIKSILDKSVRINLKGIDVNILGIERGK